MKSKKYFIKLIKNMYEEDIKYISNLLSYKLYEYMPKVILCQKKDCLSC